MIFEKNECSPYIVLHNSRNNNITNGKLNRRITTNEEGIKVFNTYYQDDAYMNYNIQEKESIIGFTIRQQRAKWISNLFNSHNNNFQYNINIPYNIISNIFIEKNIIKAMISINEYGMCKINIEIKESGLSFINSYTSIQYLKKIRKFLSITLNEIKHLSKNMNMNEICKQLKLNINEKI